MKKVLKIFASMALAFAITLSVVSCAAAPAVSSQNSVLESEEACGQISAVSFLSASPAVVTEEGTMTQTITATVLPETASDKSVDWSVTWQNPEGEFEAANDVADYVTVTPTADGSTEAVVTVHQAFPDDALAQLTVTTRVGSRQASTTVQYIGIPTEMFIETTEVIGKGSYVLTQNSTVINFVSGSFSVGFANLFGLSTDTFINDYMNLDVSVELFGSFVADEYLQNSTTYAYELVTTGKTVNWSDCHGYSNAFGTVDAYTVSVEGSSLSISFKKFSGTMLEELNDTSLNTDNYRYQYVSGVENCYAVVTVTDTYTGLSTDFRVSIAIEDVSGVEVSSDTLLF